MECDERKNKTGELDVEVKCKTKTELIDSIAASAKLSKADAGRTMSALNYPRIVLLGLCK